MNFLSILALAMSCFVSYGSVRLATQIPKTVEEAQTLLESEQEDLAKAKEKHEEIQKENIERFNKGLLPGGKKSWLELTEEERKEYGKIANQLNADLRLARENVIRAERSVEVRKEHLEAFQTDGSLENLNKEKEALIAKAKETVEQANEISPEAFRFVGRPAFIRKSEDITAELDDIIKTNWDTNKHIQEAINRAKGHIKMILGQHTEAKGPNKCATCDDEVSPLHTAQVERPENTNPEVAKETSGKAGSHGGSSGSR